MPSTSQEFIQELNQFRGQMSKKLVPRENYKKLGNMIGNSVFST